MPEFKQNINNFNATCKNKLFTLTQRSKYEKNDTKILKTRQNVLSEITLIHCKLLSRLVKIILILSVLNRCHYCGIYNVILKFLPKSAWKSKQHILFTKSISKKISRKSRRNLHNAAERQTNQATNKSNKKHNLFDRCNYTQHMRALQI